MAETTEKGKELGAIRPTLFIGLGGTGKEVLLRLRRKFYENLGRTDLPCVAYLWADTDTHDHGAQGEALDEIYREVQFSERERIPLLKASVGTDLGEVIRNTDKFSYIHEWLYPQVEQFGREIANGAGNVRAIGRLTFFYNFPTIRDRINSLATDTLTVSSIDDTKQMFLKRKWPVPDFITQRQAIVVFSCVGGTGAGTFLDTAFLLRYLQDTLMFDQLIGICVMPNIYFTERSDEVSSRSYANAYAGLKELEYYTARRGDAGKEQKEKDADKGRDTFDYLVKWEPDIERKVQGPPFHVTYVLERNNEQGVGIKERPEFFRMVAESLYMDFMPGAFSTMMRSSHANVKTILASPAEDSVKVGGAALQQAFSRRYASFGLGKLEIPTEALKGACGCQLASDISKFWCRECRNPDILGDVNRDMAEHQLTFKALAGRFVSGWRETVRREVQRAVSALVANPKAVTEGDIENVRQAFGALEDKLIGTQGANVDTENNLSYRFKIAAPGIADQVKAALMKWIGKCLEDPARGPKGLLMMGDEKGGTKGYLQVMTERLQQTFLTEKSECMNEKQSAGQYAESWRGEKETHFTELRKAASLFVVGLMAGKAVAVNHHSKALQDAEEQYVIRMAEAALYDWCRQVASEAVNFLAEKTVNLQEFMRDVEGLSQPFLDMKESLLKPGQNVLFIQVYDEQEDWPKFYKLDEQPVQVAAEAKLLMGSKTLHDIYSEWREQGRDHLSKLLKRFAEKRFGDDFAAHPRQIDLMQHKLMQGEQNLKMRAQMLVAAALSRAQVKTGFGQAAQTKRGAFLGIVSDAAERRKVFVQAVMDSLQGYGYATQNINVQDTHNKGEVYLYTVNYAFPLPVMPLVGSICHDTYYSFYRDLRRKQVGTRNYYRIPVHADRRWEGKFEDLTWMSDEEAVNHKEALEIMLFGAVLGVTYRKKVKDIQGLVEFGYRRKEMLRTVDKSWGNRKETLDALKNDGELRRRFREAVIKREGDLDAGKLRAYAHALVFTSTLPAFGEGTVEKALILKRFETLLPALQKKDIVLKDEPVGKDQTELWDWTRREAADLLVWPDDSELPVLAGMEPFVYQAGA